MCPDPNFWSGQRVFLTGHTGFKGGWLSLWLASMGAQVRGYSLPPDVTPSLFETARVADAIDSVIGDVRDIDALSASMSAFEPTVVFHLAAQSLVRRSYARPLETYATNVLGVANVLESARRIGGLRTTVIVTSDKCYENRETLEPYREGDRLGGRDPYSSSKACAELVAHAYAASFFSDGDQGVASVRAGNVIGGGDWCEDRLLPDLMTAFAEGRPAVIRRPTAVRPWQHVLEPLSGYLLAAEATFGRPGADGPAAWNFGPDQAGSRDVGAVVEIARRFWGDGAEVEIRPDPDAPHEAGLLTLDSAKATAELGWRPRWDLDASVRNTVEWFKAFHGGADMRAFTLSQIEDYDAVIPAAEQVV